MIFCHMSDKKCTIDIQGTESDIRNEMSSILVELKRTATGGGLIRAALKQSEDPEWQEKYDKEIRQFPDPNGRNKA